MPVRFSAGGQAQGVVAGTRPTYVCFRCQSEALLPRNNNRRRAFQSSHRPSSTATTDPKPPAKTSLFDFFSRLRNPLQKDGTTLTKKEEAILKHLNDKTRPLTPKEEATFKHSKRKRKLNEQPKSTTSAAPHAVESGWIDSAVADEDTQSSSAPVKSVVQTTSRRQRIKLRRISTTLRLRKLATHGALIRKVNKNSLVDSGSFAPQLRIRLFPSTSAAEKPSGAEEENQSPGVEIDKIEGSRTLQEALKVRRKSRSAREAPGETFKIKTGDVVLTPIDVEVNPIPRLAYDLDRVLFNPGVTELRDLNSRVFNFDPYLEKIMPVKEFDFDTIGRFTTPSKDERLARIAATFEKKFIGSSSSLTGVLKHFHYLLSNFRKPTVTSFSREIPVQADPSFTKIQYAPEAVLLRWKDGVYAMDSDKEYEKPNILSLMGQYMERLLTVDKEVFEKHRRGKSHELTEDQRSSIDSYHYSTIGDFIMRSQLDAQNSKLPGSGVFDLKTRAVLPIRMSTKDYEWGMTYELKQHKGEYESYEREFYDMLRATMLKYSLQVRMGRMDGIFVAYHNIARIFGFQYVSVAEMDSYLHGQRDPCLGDQEFAFSLHMLSDLLNRAIAKFPKQTLRIHVEAREGVSAFMYMFVEPLSEEQADAIQTMNTARVKAWEDKVMGLVTDDQNNEPAVAAVQDDANDTSSPDVSANGEKPNDTDSTSPADEQFFEAIKPDEKAHKYGPLAAYTVTARSRVNGKNVQRPNAQSRNISKTPLTGEDVWELQWGVSEVEVPQRAWALYDSTKKRRKKQMVHAEEDDDANNFFINRIRDAAKRSAVWRSELDATDEGKPIRMWSDEISSDTNAQRAHSMDKAKGAPAKASQAVASIPTRPRGFLDMFKAWISSSKAESDDQQVTASPKVDPKKDQPQPLIVDHPPATTLPSAKPPGPSQAPRTSNSSPLGELANSVLSAGSPSAVPPNNDTPSTGQEASPPLAPSDIDPEQALEQLPSDEELAELDPQLRTFVDSELKRREKRHTAYARGRVERHLAENKKMWHRLYIARSAQRKPPIAAGPEAFAKWERTELRMKAKMQVLNTRREKLLELRKAVEEASAPPFLKEMDASLRYGAATKTAEVHLIEPKHSEDRPTV